jgi:hypothetical protein
MIRLNILLPIFCSVLVACAQNETLNSKGDTKQNSKDTTIDRQLSFDTSKIVILSIDTSNPWVFKDVTSIELTNQELTRIDELLDDCIKVHNITEDTTREFSEYIDLKKYKRQYIPFLNSKGEKKVYVNCFCISAYVNEFDYWKKDLVEVEDGGSCFFHVTINLKDNKYEQLYTNGYG